MPPRSRVALGIVAAVLGAQGAAAQPLAERVGTPVPFRVGLPADASVFMRAHGLGAETGTGLVVMVETVDGMKLPPMASSRPGPAVEAEERRAYTRAFLSVDTMLIGGAWHVVHVHDIELADVVTGMRTLGGEPSGYLEGRIVGGQRDGGWLGIDVTMKDAILYALILTTPGDPTGHEALIARIRASFVLADAPPP